MGVTGLWTVLQPVARPVKLETLNRKRLAVDASIWIYQFLKAVRDKEGNALRNSHVVGFFRRICKLLFFGIKPVFVFDGGAPILKRQTITQRKQRREGRREDAVRTAGKLLAVQMHRRAEEEEKKRKSVREDGATVGAAQEEEPLPENLTYVGEAHMTAAEKARSRQFRKKDAYHLPDLDVSLTEMGAPNDPRIMSQEELEEYARQFHEGEDINLYDFSKIDFDSQFFTSLPATDRYNILNAARLRSRLRMGYSKEQLDEMFPDRMAFSRFQIERVKERNDLTQRLMNINGMNPNDVGSGRIAGEKGKEYVLVKNDGVEGGWALGVVSNKDEGKREKPIDLDLPPPAPYLDNEDSDESFEDVPVEGLNRLPKRPKRLELGSAGNHAQQGTHSTSHAADASTHPGLAADDDDDGLFVSAAPDSDAEEEFEDVTGTTTGDSLEDEELQRAIQMSLEQESESESVSAAAQLTADKARAERLRKAKALEFSKIKTSGGRSFASYANARAAKAAPRPTGPDDSMNPELRAAFEAGRKMGHKKKEEEVETTPRPTSSKPEPNKQVLVQPSEFKGPLPFESINLGKSLFSKKKKSPEKDSEKAEEEGGFEKADDKDKPKPLPPWFSGDIGKEEFQHSHIQQRQQQQQRKQNDDDDTDRVTSSKTAFLKRSQTGEVIDLDADDGKKDEPIQIEDSDAEEAQASADEEDVKMDDVADKIRAEPPVSNFPDAAELGKDGASEGSPVKRELTPAKGEPPLAAKTADQTSADAAVYSPGEDSFEWEQSDYEDRENLVLADDVAQSEASSSPEPEFEDVATNRAKTQSPSPEPDFEDVGVPKEATSQPEAAASDSIAVPSLPEDDTFEQAPAMDMQFEDEFSDPEDEELMRQLAIEAEEHARFASQLNLATGLQSAADYEQELKQLRNQQRADRRDADEVTTIMIQECQQLLRLFGLPYITAPMEAEAQCAELVSLGLVDGIVTDDSDIFLFGGTRVYKNMFNQAKFVECYLFNDLEKEYGLTREKIIQIAHLLGSDYTDGVPGVGPVTALEIMTEFGSVQAFQEWWSNVQMGIAPADPPKSFKKRFRKNAAKIFLPHGFPDPRVDQAYLKPEVDSDPSAFQWGVPDLEALRQFLMSTIGWSPQRTDEILVPVIRDMNKREAEGTQANMTRFFGSASGGPARVGAGASASAGAGGDSREAYAPRRRQEGKSSRMENALERLHQQTKNRITGGGRGGDAVDAEETDEATTAAGNADDDDKNEDDGDEEGMRAGRANRGTASGRGTTTKSASGPKKRRKAGAKTARDEATTNDDGSDAADVDDSADDDDDDEEEYAPPKKASKKRATSGRQRKRV